MLRVNPLSLPLPLGGKIEFDSGDVLDSSKVLGEVRLVEPVEHVLLVEERVVDFLPLHIRRRQGGFFREAFHELDGVVGDLQDLPMQHIHVANNLLGGDFGGFLPD